MASGQRGYHDALEDAHITAAVWLRMTMGQVELSMSDGPGSGQPRALSRAGLELARFEPNEADLQAHEEMLKLIDGKSEQGAAWLKEFKEK